MKTIPNEITIRFDSGTVVVAVLFLLVGYFAGSMFPFGGLSQPTITGQAIVPSPTQQAQSRIQVDFAGEPSIGSNSAKVVMVEFTDYQCPFCKRAHDDTFPQIKKDYIDTGKVRYVVKDFPLPFHTEADEAAEAAGCAFKQSEDKFWEMHNLLFEKQGEWAGTSNPKSIFKAYAQDLGLNTAAFNSCLDSSERKGEVDQDTLQGSNYGVSGTPTFYINGLELVGAQPYVAFKQTIDAELA